jgi:hypothetical protein
VADAPITWAIHVPDTDFVLRMEDLTLDDVEAVETRTGRSWLTINPAMAADFRALFALAHIKAGIDDTETAKRLSTYDAPTLLGALEFLPATRPAAAVTGGTGDGAGEAEDPTPASSPPAS